MSINTDHVVSIPHVGSKISILEWADSNDKSYVSEVLHVVAVDYPFVIVEKINSYTSDRVRINLDLRGIVWKPLSNQYVSAYMNTCCCCRQCSR